MIPPRQQDLLPMPLAIAACRRVWAARDELLRLGIVPFIPLDLLFRALQSIQTTMFTELQKGASADPALLIDTMLRMVLTSLGLIAVISIFSVNWIRQMTMGRTAVPGLGLNLSQRHLHFVFVMIMLVVITFGASLAISTLFSLIGLAPVGLLASLLVMVIGYLILLTRLSPAWIGIALDAPMPFKLAWQRTRGQGGRLVGALLITAFPAMAAQWVLGLIFYGTGLLEAAPLAFSALSTFISLAFMAVQINLFVLVYPRFVSETV